MIDTKNSNPKEAFGDKKVPLGLVPDTINAEVALAYLEGALKYGRYNWRIVGVRASTYNDALERHRMDWWNGQDRDPITRVKNLASIIACAGILLDAELCGMLNDDRPPAAPIADHLDNPDVLAHIAHLKELFKDHHPKQYTIADTPPPAIEVHEEPAEVIDLDARRRVDVAHDRLIDRARRYGTDDFIAENDL